MAFPETRLTVMQRLAEGGSPEDWRLFLADYWGPVFQFCLRRGAFDRITAEEIASDVFAILWTKGLLRRWHANRAAKLRTLICAVALNLLSERRRAAKHHEPLDVEPPDDAEDADCFYAAWADDVLRRSIETLAVRYRREGKGDYLRVYLGRTCENLSIREVAQALSLRETKVDHCYRHVRDALRQQLSATVREQIAQYCDSSELEAEFAQEWQRLAQYLQKQGDLEQLLRQSFADLSAEDEANSRQRGIAKTVNRLSTIQVDPSSATS